MRKLLIPCISILILMACNQDASKNNHTDVKPDVYLYTMDGGSIQVNNLKLFSQGDRYINETKLLANAYYLIEHPNGRLLWDTGLPNTISGKEPYTSPDGDFIIERKETVAKQLNDLNLSTDDIDFVSLSHTDFEQSGGISVLKKATWIVQESEYTYVKSDEIKASHNERFNAIKDIFKIKIINGDYDVFGDGTVIIKYTPGPTPGHCSLYVDTVNGPKLLSGDLYHFDENRKNADVPSFNVNAEQTIESMKLFESFAKTKNAEVLIAHEMSDFSRSIKGEFIYLEDAAVIKGTNFIYGVKIDDTMKKLAEKVAPLKRNEFDMVPVIVNGIITPKQDGTEGWDNIVTIKDIIKIEEPTDEGSIKLEGADTPQ